MARTAPLGTSQQWLGALSWGLVGLGVAAFAWRFIDLDLAPFFGDEPHFLDAARWQLTSGHLLTRSPLEGTSGYYYGAAVLWFYGLLQVLAGPSVKVALGAMAATLTLAQGFFAVSVARALSPSKSWHGLLRGEERWLLGTTLLLTASSPYQHFWSRLAWDQLTDAVAFVVAGLLLGLSGRSLRRAVLIGCLLGLGLSSHPMLVPFALIAGVATSLGSERPVRWRDAIGRAAGLGAAAVLVLTPWLLDLWPQRGQASKLGHASVLTLERALEVFRAPGSAGIEYFFDREWPAFLASSHAPFGWNVLAPVTQVLWVLLGLGGLLAGLRGERWRLAVIGLATLVAYPLFYAWQGIPMQPHYQFPTGWAPVLGAALLLASSRRALRRLALVAVLLISVWQLDFVAGWRGWIAEREGTRGVHYAVPLGEQTRVVAAICAHGAGPVAVSLEIVGLPASFEYLTSIDPSCARRELRWCGLGRACAEPGSQEMVARVGYATGEGARLAVTYLRRATSSEAP